MKTSFNLVKKIPGQKFADYKLDLPRLSSQIPYTFDEVVLSAKNNPKNQRKIITFRDSNNNIIERIFDYYRRPIKNQVFSCQNNVIGDREFVTSKTVKEYTMSRKKMEAYKPLERLYKALGVEQLLWKRTNTRTDHISDNIETGEKIISRTQIKPTKIRNIEKHSFIEYPHIVNNKVEKKKPKSLLFKVNKMTLEFIPNSEIEKGSKMPTTDSFIGFRAMDGDDAKAPLTRRFVKERELEKLNPKINTKYSPKLGEENLIAFYSDDDVSINFNKFFNINNKGRLASIARHEVEHMWQFFLRTLYTGGGNERKIEIAKSFKSDLKGNKIKEAKRYIKSINRYVPFNVDRKKYRHNYIERMAQNAGLKARNDYDKSGAQIRSEFSHIPSEML